MPRASKRSAPRRSRSPKRRGSMRMRARSVSDSISAAADAMTRGDQRIAQITLDEHTVVRRDPNIEHERQVAIDDLLADNHFAPVSAIKGPFHLHLSVAENRLVL